MKVEVKLDETRTIDGLVVRCPNCEAPEVLHTPEKPLQGMAELVEFMKDHLNPCTNCGSIHIDVLCHYTPTEAS